jgi:hypothetical protein
MILAKIRKLLIICVILQRSRISGEYEEKFDIVLSGFKAEVCTGSGLALGPDITDYVRVRAWFK